MTLGLFEALLQLLMLFLYCFMGSTSISSTFILLIACPLQWLDHVTCVAWICDHGLRLIHGFNDFVCLFIFRGIFLFHFFILAFLYATCLLWPTAAGMAARPCAKPIPIKGCKHAVFIRCIFPHKGYIHALILMPKRESMALIICQRCQEVRYLLGCGDM